MDRSATVRSSTRCILIALCLALPAAVLLPKACGANTPQSQLHVGRLWMNPEYDGAEGWAGSCWQYPAGIATPGYAGDPQAVRRGWVGQGRKFGTYLWSVNWTDPEGTVWNHAMSYAFRDYNYNYPNTYTSTDDAGNMNYLYPVRGQEILRWARPTVSVVSKTASEQDTLITVQFYPGEDGLDSAVYHMPYTYGAGPRPSPVIDPSLVTEEVIESTWRYIQGVELNRRMYAWPYGTPHQDYVIWDMTLTNNGISGNRPDATGSEPWNMASNSIENMVFAQAFDPQSQSTDGIIRDEDAVVVYPFGAASHPAVLCWDTDDPDTPGPDWGDPSDDEGYFRPTLVGNCYALLGCLFASSGPGDGIATDDTAQPAFIMAGPEDGVDVCSAGCPAYLTYDHAGARLRAFGGSYTLGVRGEGLSFQNDTRYADVIAAHQGPTVILGYGKVEGAIDPESFASHGWDVPMAGSVRLVQLMASGGIDNEEAVRIATTYRENEAAYPGAPSTWMSEADIALVRSGEDTVMKAAAMAYWNFHGQFPPNVTSAMLTEWHIADYPPAKPAGHEPYDVPDGPRPPGFVFVHGRQDRGMQVIWGKDAESEPDHDTGVYDLKGYRIYRQETSNNDEWLLVADFESADWAAERTEEAVNGITIPAGRYFNGHDITPGRSYHYCVVAYDDGTQNWAQPGVSIESTRWWTWTGYAGKGAAAPNSIVIPSVGRADPCGFSLSQNVPNPFNPATSIVFSLPEAGDVRLSIHNVAGQLVRALVGGSVDAGEHSATWDGTDDAGRAVASGVYVCRLTVGGVSLTKRMTLLR